MKVLMSIFMLFSLMACQGGGGSESVTPLNPPTGPHSKQIQDLIDQHDLIDRDFAERTIMSSTTTTADQRAKFKDFLVRSRRLLVLLLDQPSNEDNIKELELLVLASKDMAIPVQDLSYVVPYRNGLTQLVDDLYRALETPVVQKVVANFLFTKENTEKLIFEKEAGAADFSLGRNDEGESYLSPKSHRPPKTGKTTLTTPAFDLGSGEHSLQFAYWIRFYKAQARKEKMIKFYVGEDNKELDKIDWLDLELELGSDMEFNAPSVLTTEKVIPYANTKVRVMIEYNSDAARGFTQAFNIFRIEIKESK